jgi:hypothetical protein
MPASALAGPAACGYNHPMTYNLWGFDCVKLTLGQKIVRVGTDDAENLAKFLRERTGHSGRFE